MTHCFMSLSLDTLWGLDPYIHTKIPFWKLQCHFILTYAKRIMIIHSKPVFPSVTLLNEWQHHPPSCAGQNLSICCWMSPFPSFPTSNTSPSSLSHSTNISWFHFFLHFIYYSPFQGQSSLTYIVYITPEQVSPHQFLPLFNQFFLMQSQWSFICLFKKQILCHSISSPSHNSPIASKSPSKQSKSLTSPRK